MFLQCWTASPCKTSLRVFPSWKIIRYIVFGSPNSTDALLPRSTCSSTIPCTNDSREPSRPRAASPSPSLESDPAAIQRGSAGMLLGFERVFDPFSRVIMYMYVSFFTRFSLSTDDATASCVGWIMHVIDVVSH
jgi:hypothetical protein